VVDKKTFKWRYDPNVARQAEEAEKRKEETRREVAKQEAFLELWESIGFEFIGVRRIDTEGSCFFLREEGDYYVIIGPAGNILREKSKLCSDPDTFSPGDFTIEQLKKAGDEFIREKQRQSIEDTREIIRYLRETDLLREEVYCGPLMVRIADVIPASGVIFVANVSALTPCTIPLGWGTVLEPLYLVINVLGFGIKSDTRYGVFKICLYELLKRDLVVESEGFLNLTVTLDAEVVSIGSGENVISVT